MNCIPVGARYGRVSIVVLLAVSGVMVVALARSGTADERSLREASSQRLIADHNNTAPSGFELVQVPQAAPEALGGGGGDLVYSNNNTGSMLLFPPGAFFAVADDVFLGELCGCPLDSYSITVSGGGDGTGPGFTVTYGLYEDCPSLGGALIPGTDGETTLPDDGTHVVTFDYTGPPLTIGPALWIRAMFNQNNVGWLAGVAPEIGFSDDLFDFPTIPCVSTFPGTLYASFAAQITCEPLLPPVVESPNPADGASNISVNSVLSWNDQLFASSFAGGPGQASGVVTAETFESGTVHPDEFLAEMQRAVAAGEVPDPSTVEKPAFAPRTYFGPGDNNVAGFSVPQVTPDDIFLFEDTNSVLISQWSNGQLFSLMADATNQVIAAHGDNFDFMAFWLSFVPDHQIGGAFYLGMENDVSGIGLGLFSNRASQGVVGDNVEGWVMMWREASWPAGLLTVTQLVLGQEFEHRFGMFLLPMAGGRTLQGNNGSCGRSAHWNFRVDGQGSGMEIPEWTGSSPAVRQGGTLNFNTDITDSVFSYPDLYLMGYVSGGEMDAGASELRYLDDNTSCSSPYNGTISTWGSADIVATNGPRTPNSIVAQKHFSTGWVMIHLPGALPTANQINKTVNMLNSWNESWITSTINRGTMTNVLDPGDGPQFCAISYEVVLDTVSPPTTNVCSTLDATMCDPGALDANTTYFWQVTATDNVGTTEGPVWTFTTGDNFMDCNDNGIDDPIDIANGTSDDCNGNGIPDECETDDDGDGVPNDCDICNGGDDNVDSDGDTVPDFCDICNGGDDNIDSDGDGVPDFCDICNGGDDSVDSDGDGVPNDCDICDGGDDNVDTDGDTVPDFCDNCSLANPDQTDCQPNGTGDVCDIAFGGSDDFDMDGVPDECQDGALSPHPEVSGTCVTDDDCRNGNPNAQVDCIGPLPELGGGSVCYVAKNRYFSLAPNPEQSTATARRVSLDAPGGAVVLGWVGQPLETVVAGEDTLLMSRIVDEPFFTEWSTVLTPMGSTVVHVGDCAVSPGQTYLIQSIALGGDIGNEDSYSSPLSVRTVDLWGDVSGAQGVADGTRSLVDVQDVVFGFQGVQLQSKVQLDLEGSGDPHNIPDVAAINLADAFRAVEGFQGGDYPFSLPQDCP